MSVAVPSVYPRLQEIRKSTTASLKSNPFIRPEIKLRYYQIIGVMHMVMLRRMILGDDTGIGKTGQVITSYSYLKEKNDKLKMVVLAPKSALYQWVEEVDKFTTGLNAQVIDNKPKRGMGTTEWREQQYKEFFEDPDRHIFVINYHLLVRDYELFAKYAKDYMVVYDEATAFKGSKSKTNHVCKQISLEAERVVGLTATLLKNHLMEGFAIYSVVVPGLFGSERGFKKKYCIERKMTVSKGNRRFKIPVIVGYKNLDGFRETIDPFFLGRRKQDVSTELPDLITKEVSCDMTKSQAAAYQDALLGMLELSTGEVIETDTLSKLIYCQQIADCPAVIDVDADSGKVKEFFRLLENEFADTKVIVYTRFKRVVNYMQEQCQIKGIPMLRVTGDEDTDQRTLARIMFSEDKKKLKTFLEAQPKRKLQKWRREVHYLKEKIWPNLIFITDAGSEAINLQAAGGLIFFDSPWSFGNYQQILGRMIRIGSEHETVLAVHMVSTGTIDKHVLRTLSKKKAMVEQVFGKVKKGTLEFEHETELADLFAAMMEDARKAKK